MISVSIGVYRDVTQWNALLNRLDSVLNVFSTAALSQADPVRIQSASFVPGNNCAMELTTSYLMTLDMGIVSFSDVRDRLYNTSSKIKAPRHQKNACIIRLPIAKMAKMIRLMTTIPSTLSNVNAFGFSTCFRSSMEYMLFSFFPSLNPLYIVFILSARCFLFFVQISADIDFCIDF